MDYSALEKRIRKSLNYGSAAAVCLPATVTKARDLSCKSTVSQDQDGDLDLNSSLSLTRVVVERFGENTWTGDNLFLEKLCLDFASNLSREACLTPCSLVLALIYLERLCIKNPNFVSSIPSSKLFLISVMVASKFLNDEGVDDEIINSEFASSAKMELKDLNKLERDFLLAIDWDLFVDEEDFDKNLALIERRVAEREGLKRDTGLTYTELEILAQSELLSATWDLINSLVLKLTAVAMTAYLASLMTLVGSAIVVNMMPWNQQLSTTVSQYNNNSYNLKSYEETMDRPRTTETDLRNIMRLGSAEDESSLTDDVIVNLLNRETETMLKGMDSWIILPPPPMSTNTFTHLSNPPYVQQVSTIRLPPFNSTSPIRNCKNILSLSNHFSNSCII